MLYQVAIYLRKDGKHLNNKNVLMKSLIYRLNLISKYSIFFKYTIYILITNIEVLWLLTMKG